ncbi:hypothetical protein [Pseudomonas sp. 8AS]|nr:hypothetical protein [Pseudomonas sp. 8AS]
MNEAEKGAHFRPAGRCGAMKDRRKLPADPHTHQYQKVLILMLLDEK